MEGSISQCKAIRNWLEEGNTITPLQALNLFGTMKLSSRISELIHNEGMTIQKQTIELPNKKRVKMYYL